MTGRQPHDRWSITAFVTVAAALAALLIATAYLF
jgi:hypothetical protein